MKLQVEDLGEDASTEAIWKVIDSNLDKMMPFIHQTADRWNNRNQNAQNLL